MVKFRIQNSLTRVWKMEQAEANEKAAKVQTEGDGGRNCGWGQG